MKNMKKTLFVGCSAVTILLAVVILAINWKGIFSSKDYVDLGLSVKWATMNVGATKPYEYGDYFAWGETEPYYEAGYAQEDPQEHWKEGKSHGYEPRSNKHFKDIELDEDGDVDDYSLSKYNNDRYYGTVDDKTVLDPEDDAATANWGKKWRMPTNEEIKELIDNCEWTWYDEGNSEFKGVAGYKAQSKKAGYTDKWIFLPAAGSRDGSGLDVVGNWGYYLSSSLCTDWPRGAYFFGVHSSPVGRGHCSRYGGHSVRPVCQ